jgi:hypothetical protein
VAFEQGLAVDADRPAVVQRLAAVGPARSWPPPLGNADGSLRSKRAKASAAPLG